jgi:NAD(P)-dependent dehydrogenase (short-subunit alcohol dehydrogenase family)
VSTDFQQFLNLSGKDILVTGAAGSLGRVFCSALLSLGSQVILVDKDTDRLKALSTEFSNKGLNKFDFIALDLADENSRLTLKEVLESKVKKLDILINNAGYISNGAPSGYIGTFTDQNLANWRAAFNINLETPFHLSQILLDLLRSSKSPAIINIASIHGLYPPDWSLYASTDMGNSAAYSSSKAGLIHLTKWLASTLGPKIRVNSISPGGIERNQDASFIERYSEKTFLGRMAKESDIVGALIFLCSEMSVYCSGINIEVSGGWGR